MDENINLEEDYYDEGGSSNPWPHALKNAMPLIVIALFVLVGIPALIIFFTYIFTHGNAFKASTADSVHYVYWIAAACVASILGFIALRLARNAIAGWGDLGDARVKHAEARMKLIQAEVAALQARVIPIGERAVAIVQPDETIEVVPLIDEKEVYQHRFVEAAEDPKLIEGPSDEDPRVALDQLHIPTFAESLARGEIGPGQQEVLICYELLRDDEDKLTGEVQPYKDKIEDNSTMFLGGGSKSGKSTLITHLAVQQAMMGAMFYVIDPHLTHPDKSIAKRLEPLKDAFILPPAMSDAEVFTVLTHAMAEGDARLNNRETRLSGRPIFFIVDEILNLFGRAQRATNPEIIQLYRELALFMRDLGTQYNKFKLNGAFASQYVTKDAFKLPGNSVDFRDGCQSQGLLRLPPNQAQAMRLLPSSDLRGMKSLPTGHGYMGFYSGDVIRMAFGNVLVRDVEQVAKMLQPSPYSRRQYAGTAAIAHIDGMPYEQTTPQAVTSPLDRPPRILREQVSTSMRPHIVSASGNSGNAMGTRLETPIQADAPEERYDPETSPARMAESSVTQKDITVGNEIRETIRRMRMKDVSHRDIAYAVGLSGRKYAIYQQVCREEGLADEQGA